jgi:SagB-type dehydrogenase family enzyme
MRKTKIDMDGIGTNFFQSTKYKRDKMQGTPLQWDIKPDTYKNYPKKPTYQLIPPEQLQGVQKLKDILETRRSVRSFSDDQITISELSYLLWGSTGISKNIGRIQLRTAPSAGGLYPIETYLVFNRPIPQLAEDQPNQSIPTGLYHYNIRDHKLEQIKTGNFAEKIAMGALNQKMAASAPVVWVWSAVFPRNLWKYKQRGYRYIFLDAGHIAAHLSLTAVDLGLKTCQIAALYDDEINQLFNLDGEEESVIYLSVVGK